VRRAKKSHEEGTSINLSHTNKAFFQRDKDLLHEWQRSESSECQRQLS
jgi:hypothetical protein